MQDQDKPKGPWSNPPLEEGIYDAVIDELRHTTYGKNDDPMVQIFLRIPSEEAHLVTNVYFPEGRSHGSQHRLWYLSISVDLELFDVYEYPDDFEGRKLRVLLKRQDNGQGGTQIDIAEFLPSPDGWEQNEEESNYPIQIAPDWISPLGKPA